MPANPFNLWKIAGEALSPELTALGRNWHRPSPRVKPTRGLAPDCFPMIWSARTARDTDNAALRRRLGDAADQLYANSGLKAHDAGGIIHLPAEARFDNLVNRPEDENMRAKVNAAMRNVPKCGVGLGVSEFSQFGIRHLHRLAIHNVERTDETGRLCRQRTESADRNPKDTIIVASWGSRRQTETQ